MAKKDFKKTAAELFISTAESPQEAPQAAREGFLIPKGYKLVRETKSTRLQLLVRPSTKEALKEEAAALGISVNDLANNIFEDYISTSEREGEQ